MCNKKQEIMNKLSGLIDNIPPDMDWSVDILLGYSNSNRVAHDIQWIHKDEITEICSDIKQYVISTPAPEPRKWWQLWR